MGRATGRKDEQIKYIKHRLRLLNEVGQSLDESADVEDLNQLNQMLDKLKCSSLTGRSCINTT